MSWLVGFHKFLSTWPDELLTWILIGMAAIGLGVAFFGKTHHKALLTTYWLLP